MTPLLGVARKLISRLLSVKSARGVSFTLSIVSMSSKPLGYLRMLVTAWAFGTSPGMDSFHLASSIIALFAGSIGSAMESAVLPELVRLREKGEMTSCRSVFAVTAWIVVFLASLLCAALIIAPGVLIRFFASGFDAERIRMGAIMLWWLMPFAVVTMIKPLLTVWAMLEEKYTLSCVTASVFNFVAIPALLAGIPLIGVYSVAMSMSAGHAAAFILLFLGLRGIPLIWRKGTVPWSSLRAIALNSCLTLVIVGATTIFMIVDRYFASRLPSGSVAAISYGGTVMGIITTAATTPLVFFLARISKSVAVDEAEARATVQQTIALMMAYFIPVSFFAAATARSIISIVYGWGNFGTESVAMTATAFSAYSYGIAFSLCATILYRYAQAQQKLGVIVILTYTLILTNAVLDWAMVGRWGIGGLALATSITQAVSFVIYYCAIIGSSLPRFLLDVRFFHQVVFAGVFAGLAWRCVELGSIWQLAIAAGLAAAYLFLADRLGLFRGVPEHWRPVRLAAYLFSNLRSCVK